MWDSGSTSSKRYVWGGASKNADMLKMCFTKNCMVKGQKAQPKVTLIVINVNGISYCISFNMLIVYLSYIVFN